MTGRSYEHNIFTYANKRSETEVSVLNVNRLIELNSRGPSVEWHIAPVCSCLLHTQAGQADWSLHYSPSAGNTCPLSLSGTYTAEKNEFKRQIHSIFSEWRMTQWRLKWQALINGQQGCNVSCRRGRWLSSFLVANSSLQQHFSVTMCGVHHKSAFCPISP